MGKINNRLAELGITVPTPAKPVANYVGWVRTGNLVFTTGQVTFADGKFHYIGKVGAEISTDDAQKAARLCAINIIAQLREACGGDLDRVKRIVKLVGFVERHAGVQRTSEGHQWRFGPDGRSVRRRRQARPFRRGCRLPAAEHLG